MDTRVIGQSRETNAFPFEFDLSPDWVMAEEVGLTSNLLHTKQRQSYLADISSFGSA
jgi:hypothetical protein